MKNIILFLILILCSTEGMHAQIHISANLRQDGKFNKTTKLYDSAFNDNTALSTFEFDKDFTIFRHKTNSKTSIYLIKSQKNDEGNGRWEFDVISDAGYSYYVIIDILNKNIRFIYKANGSTYLAQFVIDRFWIDK